MELSKMHFQILSDSTVSFWYSNGAFKEHSFKKKITYSKQCSVTDDKQILSLNSLLQLRQLRSLKQELYSLSVLMKNLTCFIDLSKQKFSLGSFKICEPSCIIILQSIRNAQLENVEEVGLWMIRLCIINERSRDNLSLNIFLTNVQYIKLNFMFYFCIFFFSPVMAHSLR